MTYEQTQRVMELDIIVAQFQKRLAEYPVTPSDRHILGILSDLLVNVDIARKDLYWALKDIDTETDNINYLGS